MTIKDNWIKTWKYITSNNFNERFLCNGNNNFFAWIKWCLRFEFSYLKALSKTYRLLHVNGTVVTGGFSQPVITMWHKIDKRVFYPQILQR